MTRRLALAAAAVCAALLIAPGAVLAHGIVGRTDLPIPSWLFGWAAAIVLAASFAALGALWKRPRLQEPRETRLFRIPRAVGAVCGLVGIAWFAINVYAGFAGNEIDQANLIVTWVFVGFWVGIPVLSVLFGDVFRAFNPWRSLALAVRAVSPRGWRTRPYPERLGIWPAVAGLVLFAWVELAYANRDVPEQLATMALVYAAIQLVGMAVYGIEEWSDRGDAFGVYFGMFARLAPLVRRDGVLYRRPLLSGAPSWPIVPGSVAFLAVAIGSTTFDGLSNGPVWASLRPDLIDLFGGGTAAGEIAATIGLTFCILLIGGFFRLGVEGMHTVGHGYSGAELARLMVHTLIPIAFAYLLAHYFSLLIFEGQRLGYLISDPLGDGSDIFGTAGGGVDYRLIGSEGIWYVQVAALITGHVAGLVLAHDRALTLYTKAREAARSQYWMLVVMVGFTSLGLWLLSTIGAR